MMRSMQAATGGDDYFDGGPMEESRVDEQEEVPFIFLMVRQLLKPFHDSIHSTLQT